MRNTKYYSWAVEHRHPIFLVGLLLFFILPEVFEKVFFFPIPQQLIITVLVVSSMLLIRTSARFRLVPYVFVIALIIFIFIWNNYGGSPDIEKAAYIFLFIYSIICFIFQLSVHLWYKIGHEAHTTVNLY